MDVMDDPLKRPLDAPLPREQNASELQAQLQALRLQQERQNRSDRIFHGLFEGAKWITATLAAVTVTILLLTKFVNWTW